MRALVIGFGSIGERHAEVLGELGHEVGIVTKRDIPVASCYNSIRQAIDEFQPAYVIIANATFDHHSSLCQLRDAGYKHDVLVEKPLFDRPREFVKGDIGNIFVGYNLRFHPVLRRLYALTRARRILSIHVYVGQYLPDWRPLSDYRLSYSAKSAAGGGVLRDLSHELDYVIWICGSWTELISKSGHYSSLDIDSEDHVSLIMAFENTPLASIHANYVDRLAQREITINTEDATFSGDLIRGVVRTETGTEEFKLEINQTYRDEHRAILGSGDGEVCTFDQGMDVLQVIVAAEDSARERRWMDR